MAPRYRRHLYQNRKSHLPTSIVLNQVIGFCMYCDIKCKLSQHNSLFAAFRRDLLSASFESLFASRSSRARPPLVCRGCIKGVLGFLAICEDFQSSFILLLARRFAIAKACQKASHYFKLLFKLSHVSRCPSCAVFGIAHLVPSLLILAFQPATHAVIQLNGLLVILVSLEPGSTLPKINLDPTAVRSTRVHVICPGETS